MWNYLDPKIPATYQPNEPITEQALIQRALACREQLRTLRGGGKWEQERGPPLVISSLQPVLWVSVTISNAHSVIVMGSSVAGWEPLIQLSHLWVRGKVFVTEAQMYSRYIIHTGAEPVEHVQLSCSCWAHKATELVFDWCLSFLVQMTRNCTHRMKLTFWDEIKWTVWKLRIEHTDRQTHRQTFPTLIDSQI